MATIKISDLSVGDWVQYRDREWQVCSLYQFTGEVGLWRKDSQICENVADCKPIPITAELLEKNGWKLSKSNWFEFEDGEWKINIWIGKSKCNIEISQKREIYMFTYADIQVVKSNINTLQHALRLAGVDKEINL